MGPDLICKGCGSQSYIFLGDDKYACKHCGLEVQRTKSQVPKLIPTQLKFCASCGSDKVQQLNDTWWYCRKCRHATQAVRVERLCRQCKGKGYIHRREHMSSNGPHFMSKFEQLDHKVLCPSCRGHGIVSIQQVPTRQES